MNDQVLHIIGAAVGEGASDGGCKWGAAALKEHGMARALAATGRTVTWGDTISAQPMLATSRLHAIEVFSDHLSVAVHQVLRHGQQPLVVGGDHSCAVGTWMPTRPTLQTPRPRTECPWQHCWVMARRA